MKLHKLLLTAIAGSFLFVSCSGDDDTTFTPPASGAYENGVFVLNQGVWGAGNAEVSFISGNLTIENNLFKGVNEDMDLGDVGQDIEVNGNFAYIVLNASNKIVVVDRNTFAHIATISQGLNNPRYIAFANGKGYVTNWGDGSSPSDDYIAVIDLASNSITGNIPVAEGPEKIIENGGKLYIAHYGGWSIGNTLTVINAATNAVSATVEVGDAPNSLTVANGKLFVLGEGIPSWAGTETFGKLHVVNLGDNTIERVIEFQGTHPMNLTTYQGSLYYTINSGIFKMDASGTALPSAPLFTAAFTPSAFNVGNDMIYIADAGNNTSNGKVYLYSLTGSALNNFGVGILPSDIEFN